ncbi:MAG: hypothetical protein KTR31_29680 [Myxococcales bacterium]|nr:hypothetical protein [Myxococcales bacterium]
MAVLRSVSARAMAPVFALLRVRDVDVRALVAAHGVDGRWVDDPSRRVTSLALTAARCSPNPSCR